LPYDYSRREAERWCGGISENLGGYRDEKNLGDC